MDGTTPRLTFYTRFCNCCKNPNEVSIMVEASENTYQRKEELKKSGFGWDGSSWVKYYPCGELEKTKECADAVIELKNKIHKDIKETFDNCVVKTDLNGNTFNQMCENAEKINALKPERPEFINGKYNGKIYGKNKIYVDGKEVLLTEDQVKTLVEYNKANDQYLKECRK